MNRIGILAAALVSTVVTSAPAIAQAPGLGGGAPAAVAPGAGAGGPLGGPAGSMRAGAAPASPLGGVAVSHGAANLRTPPGVQGGAAVNNRFAGNGFDGRRFAGDRRFDFDRHHRFHRGFGFGVAPGFGLYDDYAYDYPYYDTYAYDPDAYTVTGPAPDQAYCMQRYRSYDPATGTFLGYDGLRHPCP